MVDRAVELARHEVALGQGEPHPGDLRVVGDDLLQLLVGDVGQVDATVDDRSGDSTHGGVIGPAIDHGDGEQDACGGQGDDHDERAGDHPPPVGTFRHRVTGLEAGPPTVEIGELVAVDRPQLLGGGIVEVAGGGAGVDIGQIGHHLLALLVETGGIVEAGRPPGHVASAPEPAGTGATSPSSSPRRRRRRLRMAAAPTAARASGASHRATPHPWKRESSRTRSV